MGGRVNWLHVIAAGALLLVALVGGYWASYMTFVPAPVREAMHLVGSDDVTRSVALQRVLDQHLKPGAPLEDMERWLLNAGFENHCAQNPCDQGDHLYYYHAPFVFWPVLLSNSWSIRVFADDDGNVTEARCSVSVTAGLW